jgi:hypothetical protein
VNPVKVGFFSMTGGALSGDDAAYLEWHLLDHMPEQHSIPGIRLGTRWRADDECVALRTASTDQLAPVRHVVSYLMTDPVEQTLVSFAELGRRCAEAGRFPEPASSFLLGAFHLIDSYAAPRVRVSAAAVPFRPHRGAYLIVEVPVDQVALDGWLRWHHVEHVPAVLAVDGVAGVCTFRASTLLGAGADQGTRFGVPAWDPGGRLITVVYVDGAVTDAAARLEPLVRSRWASGAVAGQLAGPFRSMVAHTAWPEGAT